MFPRTKKSTTFYCFTPLVSLATFLVEVGAALYVWWRYRATTIGKVLASQLLFLGLFQLGEYAVCGLGPDYLWAMRLALVAVTLIPPSILHLVNLVAEKNYFVKSSYAVAGLISLYIIFTPAVLPAVGCPGKYVIFVIPQAASMAHFIYYWAVSLCAFVIAVQTLRHPTTKEQYEIMKWLLIGYMAAVVPILVTAVIYSWSFQGYGSTYCGFALFTTAIFICEVIPRLPTREVEATHSEGLPS